MTITFHKYSSENYRQISDFLIENYQPGNTDKNWLEPMWEYMHFHPGLDREFLDRIGIWDKEGKIIAFTNYESRLGEAFFQIKPGYEHLRTEMLDYAEKNFVNHEGVLHAFINDTDNDFSTLVQSRGYTHEPHKDRPLAHFDIPDPFPKINLPSGFRLLSLADEPDWSKVHRVMWRGFNHPGEPDMSPEELEMRRTMFDTITADLNLKIVVAAPNGDFVSICGMFYQPHKHYAYVEPVATDPDYRCMGLGKAAVMEGIRRCVVLGAQEAFVGSNQPFYLALGFKVQYTSQCFRKQFTRYIHV